MKKSLLIAFFGGLLLLLPVSLLAQGKTQAYYNSHENEILPDAQAAFRDGDYDRTVVLCRWHYIIVGDRAAEQLRETAEQCAQLAAEMGSLREQGKTEEAVEIARTLLSINPADSAAKELIDEWDERLNQPEQPIQEEITLPADSIAVQEPEVSAPVVTTNPEVGNQIVETVPEPASTYVIGSDETAVSGDTMTSKSPMRFVMKAAASALDMKEISKSLAFGVDLGLYDIGGSPVGFEMGTLICPDLKSKVSLFGIDASLVFRVAKGVYPKLGAGYFADKNKINTLSATQGLFAGAGFTFLLGENFCIEAGVKYFPECKVSSVEKVSTSGSSYDFPVIESILPGGIVPMIALGFAF